MKIKFISKYADWLLHPVPVKKVIPDWYKKLQIFVDNDMHKPTIRKCVPVLDAVSCGYAILAPTDIVFTKSQQENGQMLVKVQLGRPGNIQRPDAEDMNYQVQHHDKIQTNYGPVYDDEMPYTFKLLNPWIVETPPGYSCLFTPPFNTERRDIRIITGIVDTDQFKNHVNFPFMMKEYNHENGMVKIIKKGTPIALVFPFKRDDWKMEVVHEPKLYEKQLYKWGWDFFSEFIDIYRNRVWKKKTYR